MKTTDYRTAHRKKIRTIMANLDLTAKDLADRAGLSHSYVRGLISGTYSNKKGRERVEVALGYKVWSDQEPDGSASQVEAGEQRPENNMDPKSNQFAGANNPGAGSLEKSS
jgi:transcriptional regulator with XRE-family HTH domain